MHSRHPFPPYLPPAPLGGICRCWRTHPVPRLSRQFTQVAFRGLVHLNHLLVKLLFWGTSDARNSTLKPHSGQIPGDNITINMDTLTHEGCGRSAAMWLAGGPQACSGVLRGTPTVSLCKAQSSCSSSRERLAVEALPRLLLW